MTVKNQTNKVIGLGNDSATVFPFSPMELPVAVTDLTVTRVNADGTEDVLAQGTTSTTYSVDTTVFPGTGSVTFPASGGSPIATGVSLVMKRVLVLENQTDLENQGGYHADTQELSIDRLTMIDLQQQEDNDRSIKIPSVTTGVSVDLPAPVALRFLRWDTAATAIEAVAIATAAASASSVVPLATGATASAAGSAADFAREDHRHLWTGFELGAAIASVAGDTNIWANADGNVVHITGTNTITDFGTPTQAGQMMWLIFDAAASVTDSATITIQGNTNYTAAANDLALVIALTTSTFQFIPFPAAGAGTAQIAGSAVTTAKINDDAVTLAKMAGGTDGNIISFDSSGDPVAIATGSSGQVLTSAGAGAQPAMSAVKDQGWTVGELGVASTSDGTEMSADITNPIEIFIEFHGISSNGTDVIRGVFTNSSGDIIVGGMMILRDGGTGVDAYGETGHQIINVAVAASAYQGWLHAERVGTGSMWKITSFLEQGAADTFFSVSGMDDADTTAFNFKLVANGADVMDAGTWDLWYKT